jgi:two-component system cell cycle sensor histidine kinase/response regulator CckA
LKVVNEQLVQSQKLEAVGRLAGGVAHDFNNLLTVITTYADLLNSALPATSPHRQDVEEIENAARRATALTRQLLAFSRRQVLKPEDLDFSDVLRGMSGMLSRLLGEDIELVTKEGRDLRCTWADRGQLEQVIANLAINARDAMPDGGVLILETSEVNFDEPYPDHDGKEIPPGRYVLLTVSDTGDGMPEDVRKRIFDPFFTTKPSGKGTGLGLSTVFGIVTQSGGFISVYSAPRKGTTFKIYLPASARRPGASRRPTPPRALPAVKQAGRILLVEDDESVRKATQRLLERIGYQVTSEENPLQALALVDLGTQQFDLMLTDMVMPLMNGDQLAREVLARRPKMKIVIMSGYSEEASHRHWLLPPNSIFVEKPIGREVLAAKLRDALSEHH